jgi:hypothetical protein
MTEIELITIPYFTGREDVDRVRLEPTTSANTFYFLVQSALMKKEACSNPTRSNLFLLCEELAYASPPGDSALTKNLSLCSYKLHIC